jgi:hypothetical protein
MTRTLSEDQVRFLRQRAQGLASPASGGASAATAIVSRLCAVQAQYLTSAQLALRARSADLLASDVARARMEERTLVRAWLMRGTLHLVTADDFAWLQPLYGPLNAAGERRRRLQLGLDDVTAARGIQLLRDALESNGPLTRAEIVERLAAGGLRLAGQARPYLIALAAHQGILCHGPDRADGDDPPRLPPAGYVPPGGYAPVMIARGLPPTSYVASTVCVATSSCATRPAAPSATKPYAPSTVIATAVGPPASARLRAGSWGRLAGAPSPPAVAGRSSSSASPVASGR